MIRHDDSRWIRHAGRGLLLLAALLVVTFARADEARVIQLQHRTAADVMPLIRPLLGPNDALTGMDYRLIISTSDKNFREIEKLLAQLDTARRQLRITVKQAGNGETDSAHTGVSGEASSGNIRIQKPRRSPADSDGLTLGTKGGLQVETQRRSTTTSSNNTQFITTLDGAHAFIRVGQSVPHVTRILQITGNQAILSRGVTFQDVVTGFDVVARVQGQSVQLEIAPRLSHLDNPSAGLVSFQEYRTTVVVKLGEWVDIGGITGSGDEVRRAILDSASTQSEERRTVLLKVE